MKKIDMIIYVEVWKVSCLHFARHLCIDLKLQIKKKETV